MHRPSYCMLRSTCSTVLRFNNSSSVFAGGSWLGIESMLIRHWPNGASRRDSSGLPQESPKNPQDPARLRTPVLSNILLKQDAGLSHNSKKKEKAIQKMCWGAG